MEAAGDALRVDEEIVDIDRPLVPSQREARADSRAVGGDCDHACSKCSIEGILQDRQSQRSEQ